MEKYIYYVGEEGEEAESIFEVIVDDILDQTKVLENAIEQVEKAIHGAVRQFQINISNRF